MKSRTRLDAPGCACAAGRNSMLGWTTQRKKGNHTACCEAGLLLRLLPLFLRRWRRGTREASAGRSRAQLTCSAQLCRGGGDSAARWGSTKRCVACCVDGAVAAGPCAVSGVRAALTVARQDPAHRATRAGAAGERRRLHHCVHLCLSHNEHTPEGLPSAAAAGPGDAALLPARHHARLHKRRARRCSSGRQQLAAAAPPARHGWAPVISLPCMLGRGLRVSPDPAACMPGMRRGLACRGCGRACCVPSSAQHCFVVPHTTSTAAIAQTLSTQRCASAAHAALLVVRWAQRYCLQQRPQTLAQFPNAVWPVCKQRCTCACLAACVNANVPEWRQGCTRPAAPGGGLGGRVQSLPLLALPVQQWSARCKACLTQPAGCMDRSGRVPAGHACVQPGQPVARHPPPAARPKISAAPAVLS